MDCRCDAVHLGQMSAAAWAADAGLVLAADRCETGGAFRLGLAAAFGGACGRLFGPASRGFKSISHSMRLDSNQKMQASDQAARAGYSVSGIGRPGNSVEYCFRYILRPMRR
jgi:hypothetical protein